MEESVNYQNVPRIKVASVEAENLSNELFENRLVLRMTDENRTEVKFEMDVVAGALLSLTLNSALKTVQAVAAPEGGSPQIPNTPEGL